MLSRIESLYIAAMVRVQCFLNEEKGDTNFISILIILGVVIALSGTFIGFKDQIVAKVQEILESIDIH